MPEKIERHKRKKIEGTVRKDSKDKTITVLVERLVKHPLYGKYQRRRTQYHAHDEDGKARSGDRVLIMETRPLSKTKRWRVCKIIKRAGETGKSQ